MSGNIWLVGSGVMAQDYHKVLSTGLGHKPIVIGRSTKSTEEFVKKTQYEAQSGGLESFLKSKPAVPEFAIVSVSRETLSEVTCQLLLFGVKNILVEKPAGLSQKEIDNVAALSEHSNVVIGFNRRFYAPVMQARELITQDGGAQSFNFEFTEWSHKLKDLVAIKGAKVMATWFLGNSIHVADLAFYLGGFPKEISTYVKGGIEWHPTSSVFAGAGISKSGALFAYQANWESAGRWSVEVQTANYRFILRPLEELQIQKKGAITIEKVEIDQPLDMQFKPGLYLQTKMFLEKQWSQFETIQDLQKIFPIYLKMAGYENS